MASRYLQALGLAFEIASDINTIQPLHHEPRFNEIKKDFESLLSELQQTFLPNDRIAQAIVNGAKAGIDTIKFADIEPPATAGGGQ